MVNLSKINEAPEIICSIDASTNNMAFAIFHQNSLKSFGKIIFEGTNIYAKVGDATRKASALFSEFDIDAIVIEQTVYLNSPKTLVDLSMVHGALVGGIMSTKRVLVRSVPPIAWQTFIGNGKLTKEEKLKIRKNSPGKSESWYKNFERDFRKQRTINAMNISYDINNNDNDVADAIGIGHYSINNISKLF
jgi:Holliday junction resolvasome RuvABC endonuclease subunit